MPKPNAWCRTVSSSRLGMLAGAGVVTLVIAQAVWAGDVFDGRKVYRSHCSGCHGQSGTGDTGNAPDFTIGEGLMQSDLSLMQSIAQGKGVMPGYLGVLSDEEILNVISYIRAMP